MNFARIPAVLLSLAFALTLAACGEDEQPAQRNESFQSVNAQVAEYFGEAPANAKACARTSDRNGTRCIASIVS